MYFLPFLVEDAFLVDLVHLPSFIIPYFIYRSSISILNDINIFMSKHDSDTQKLFESYLSINEDVGLGPKQKGTDIMETPPIGSTGGVGKSHMNIAKSNLTPVSENEEGESLDTIIDDIILNLEVLRTAKPKIRSLDGKLLIKSLRVEVDRVMSLFEATKEFY